MGGGLDGEKGVWGEKEKGNLKGAGVKGGGGFGYFSDVATFRRKKRKKLFSPSGKMNKEEMANVTKSQSQVVEA